MKNRTGKRMRFSKNLILFVVASIFSVSGCGTGWHSTESTPRLLATAAMQRHQDSTNEVPSSWSFVVPEGVGKILKRKCYICHGGESTEGNFDLKKMVYRVNEASDWRPMDLSGVTRIKLAILPINGELPQMPKRAGSVLNSLTQEEANEVAKWTDDPFERESRKSLSSFNSAETL